MRLVLKLKSNKNVLQIKENNSKFHTGMHGWIYGKLKNTDFSEIYFEKEFKPFCFSNLFPIKKSTISEGEIYNVIISSPNEMFMVALLSQINIDDIINLGEFSFKLDSYKILPKLNIENNSIIESETIVNLTLHDNNKTKYVTYLSNPEIFEGSLSKNLIRKYNQFGGEKIEEDFNLLKNIVVTEVGNKKAIKINFVKNSDNWFNIIGLRYKFEIGEIDETQKKILELCYDLGFGERNTFGFGFMNLKNPMGKIKEKTKVENRK